MAAVAITVPGVGESITEGILSRWLKPDGAAVKAGEPLFELETDKASNVVPAPASGVLKITVAEGETVPIGASIGSLDPAGTPVAAPAKAEAADPAFSRAAGEGGRRPDEGPGTQTEASPRPSPAAARTTPHAGFPPLPEGEEISEPNDRPDSSSNGGPGMPLSPAVRRIVAEKDVDASRVPATGPGGRITKGDVLSYLESPPAKPPQPGPAIAPAPAIGPTPPPAPAAKAPTPGRETRQRMSGLRQRIAERLVQAQQTAAILTTFNEADMSRISDLRSKYKEPFRTKHGVSLGYMSFFVKAAVEALKAFPAVNARLEGNEIVFHHYYDIGVAVSTERGLMVPVLRDADLMSFADIEKAIAAYTEKARKGTIAVDDLQGGTFTITNGGIFGSLLSTPILNPPQSGILGMHAIKKRPVVEGDQIVIRPMMYLALSYDHRIIDGREAVSFLVRIKECLEDPERVMLAL
jgi:2-oxoglutarate dehydrogenase E2 component (dihydrolipoamide succinyltransferase)